MLMRYSKVSKDGLFTQRGNPRIAYAGMLETRLGISCLFPRALARVKITCYFLKIQLNFYYLKSLAIGIRYSLMRT